MADGAGGTPVRPQRPVRWLLMASHVPPGGRLGGIVRYTVELARALRRRDDVELHLLASAAAAAPLGELLGVPDRVVALPRLPGPVVPAVERYLLARRLGRFDVVQGTKHMLPRRVAARTALTVHDMLLFDRPEDFPPPKRLMLRQPYAASLRSADTLLCVSAATSRRVAAWAPPLGARSAVVPLATSPQLLSAAPVAVPALAGRPFVLVVGDTSPRKNLATAVSAWARVVRHHPGAALALVGPPPWGAEDYGPHFAGLVASGHVVQLTGVDDAVLRWCYDRAAVVLCPSLAEGFGLPASEALDLGVPLVTSMDAALLEVSGADAEHLPAQDVEAWAGAALRHLDATAGRADLVRPARTTRRRVRTWDDVAAETVAAVTGRPEQALTTGKAL